MVWYTGQFYALFYMTTVLKIDYVTVYIVMMVALILRRRRSSSFSARCPTASAGATIMTAGFALAVVSFWPVFTLAGRRSRTAR